MDEILDVGKAAMRQVSESHRTPLVSILLRGDPGCGKTALAAYIAKQCEFPFVKVCMSAFCTRLDTDIPISVPIIRYVHIPY